ncbi:hypothetical protein GCM10011414_11880 [Croceivirga lutea]|uniref:hypothetical protein n=1 Tax=Croceivirga lutea TaxID=1775167 RepID=UPI00163A214D|nr:hypothetical protein [Croceivirga lutea]GGG43856.1 hypothetical protein GCM10011414_11880 [Croceivirga lutea]
MKPTYLFIFLFSITTVVKAQINLDACEKLYNNTTYALAHAKKALKVTGFDHQVYYSERSLAMFENVENEIADCGCLVAEEKSYQAKENLKKAVDPQDWKAGRFYTQKALSEIDELLLALDNCSSENYVEPTVQSINTKESTEMNKNLAALNTSVDQIIELLQEPSNLNLTEAQQDIYQEKTKALLQAALLKLEK